MFLVTPAYAQCPICIVTVGGGMLLAKELGIDDLLVSIWISALNVAISFWLATRFKNKFLKNGYILTAILLSTTLIYFQATGQLGHPQNRLLGIDKIIFGQLLGTITMMAANHSYQAIKTRLGHTPFPYAKVVFPLGAVLTVTLIFKLLFRL
jgi:hypothetical protein